MATARPSGGFLLVASPNLLDPNFRRAVVLVITHDGDGAFGLILNRPLEGTLADVLDEQHPRAGVVPLRQGGPVQTDMLQFVSSREDRGRVVLPGVAVGASLDDLAEGDDTLLAYVGYSGWGPGQLERETEEGSWIVAPAQARHVFGVAVDRLWCTVLGELGGPYARMALEGGRPSDN